MAAVQDVIRGRLEEIRARIVYDSIELTEWDYRTCMHLGPGDYDYDTEGWGRLRVGEIWSRGGKTAFLKRRVEIPTSWAKRRVMLELDTGGEGCLFIGETPFQGIDENHRTVLLASSARGGEVFDLELELKPGSPFQYVENATRAFALSRARLIVINPEVERIFLDFQVAFEAALAVKDETLRQAYFATICKALKAIDFRNTQSVGFYESLPAAGTILSEGIRSIGFADSPARVFMAGHSHIDTAWLWPLRETVRKCSRTFSTVMRLMEEYPHYFFVQSQAQLYDYTKRYYPSLYEEIKNRVAEGRFEPIGGTWVENDCNIPSGESMVRQVLYGKRFFRREFGRDVKVGWLPDVFGYSWALPQIYRKAGIDYFMTSKISWNDTNRFPYDTFYWQGLDGTKIFTHFIPSTYNGNAKPGEILLHWDRYMQKLECPEYLYTFGYGDGGGGPTREMLEDISRMADLPGVPKAKTGRVHEFFERIAREARDLPTWNGELYFELHRGTYTTQARNKKANRRSELLYRDAEMLAALAAGITGKEYPKQTLVGGWHLILLNQFHDIIPGSSITAVYEDSARDYEQVMADGLKVREESLTALVDAIDTRIPSAVNEALSRRGWDLGGQGVIPVVVFNTLPWERTDVVSLAVPDEWFDQGAGISVIAPDGRAIPAQIEGKKLLFAAQGLPSIGYSVYWLVSGAPEISGGDSPFMVEGRRISTPYYEIELGEDGYVSRIYDRARKREIIPEGGRANVLQVFEDKPTHSEAWDIQPQYQEKVWESKLDGEPRVKACGPVRLVIGLSFCYGKSKIDQDMVFYAHTPRIDFINRVDWQERKTLLKVAFPVDVLSTRATYEIAYGVIERPTHWNTSWDRARFEVSSHKWADLSEGDYGVSLLNDCKYGWDIRDNVIRLSLLRGTESPDPQADLGIHEFTYALFPHGGDWRNGTVPEAYSLNVPACIARVDAHSGHLPNQQSFIQVDRPGVVVDAVKQAEDSDDLIVRVYEAYGTRGSTTLRFAIPIRSAVECNLMEEDATPVEWNGNGNEMRFTIKPYEIKTFKVEF